MMDSSAIPVALSIPADSALPRLQELLPSSGAPEVVVEFARRYLKENLHFRQLRLRYRPTKNCTILWECFSSYSYRFFVSGKLFSDDRGQGIVACTSFQRLGETVKLASSKRSSPYRYFPDRRLLLQSFPMDGNLPGLSLAMSEDWVRETVRSALECRERGVDGIQVEMLRYLPWHRCVLQYTVEHQGRRIPYVAKITRRDPGAARIAHLQRICADLRASDAPCRIPTPLAYIPSARMQLFESIGNDSHVKVSLSGARIGQQSEAVLKAQMVMAAKGLAAFQRVEVKGLPLLSPQTLVMEMEQEAQKLVKIAPALFTSIQNCINALDTEAKRLRPEAMALTHGAFRYNQLLFSNDKLAILDLDSICLSGASADAGEFLAYLDLQASRRPQLQPVVEACQISFAAVLREESRVRPDWLAWYRAASRVKWALRSVSSLRRGWQGEADDQLRAAQATLWSIHEA